MRFVLLPPHFHAVSCNKMTHDAGLHLVVVVPVADTSLGLMGVDFISGLPCTEDVSARPAHVQVVTW